MNIKASKKDIIWNYLGTIMSLAGNFLLLPFMMYYLDSETLGLWYVFLSVGGIVILFDFGFNPTFARNIAYSWNGASKLTKSKAQISDSLKPNIGLLKKVIKTCKRIYLVISLLALIILLTAGTLYILNISKGIERTVTISSWLIYSMAVFLNLYYGYYATFLRGVGAIREYNKVSIFSRIIQIIISIILLILGLDLIAVAIGYLTYGMLFRILSKYSFYRYKNIGLLINSDSTTITARDTYETFGIIWHNAWRDGLVSLSNYLANQASIVIASMYFSLTVTGIYSISIQLVTAIATISGALYNAYQPSLQAAYVNDKRHESKRLMAISMTAYTILFIFGIVLLLIVGIPILSVVKPDLVFDIPILLAIAIYTFLLKHHSFYASFISNTNRVPYTKAFVLSSSLSIILATLALKYTDSGIWSLLLIQIIVQLVYNNWKWPKVVMVELNTSMVEIYKIGIKEIKNAFSSNKFKKRKNQVRS